MRTVRGSSKAWGNLRKKKHTTKDFKRNTSYQKRNDILNILGFRDYKSYLASDFWIEIRNKILGTQTICLLCPSISETVHHLSYDVMTLKGEQSNRLVALCLQCHALIEFHPSGRKRSLRESNKDLKKRARKTEQGLKWLG